VTALDPSLRDAEEVVRQAGTDANAGLTSEEAASRLARHGPNRLDAKAAVPAWRRLLAQFTDPLIYLLLAAVVV
jgi:magnesium-transporting ATPase (P-type)